MRYKTKTSLNELIIFIYFISALKAEHCFLPTAHVISLAFYVATHFQITLSVISRAVFR